MTDYGLKIVKVGKDITSTDIRDQILNSNYSMFKINEIKSDSITINAGDSTGNTTVAHNLGYVPSFLVYEDGQLFPQGVRCYATSTGITIVKTLTEPYNQSIFTANPTNSVFFEDSTENYYIIAGKKISSGTGCAVRFTDITVSQGEDIVSATFEWKNVSTTTGSDLKFQIWGIDEDNTADFSSNPMGRTKTTAVNTKTQAASASEFNFGDTWTSLAQEIIDRANWASGNAMGFLFNDNGCDNGHVIAIEKSDFTVNDIVLTITRPGSLSSNYKIVIFKDKIV